MTTAGARLVELAGQRGTAGALLASLAGAGAAAQRLTTVSGLGLAPAWRHLLAAGAAPPAATFYSGYPTVPRKLIDARRARIRRDEEILWLMKSTAPTTWWP